jgi:hypothetical protein
LTEVEEELEAARAAASPQTRAQLVAALIEQLQDEPPEVLQATWNGFGKQLRLAWEKRRRDGVETRPAKKPGKREQKRRRAALDEVAADINAALRDVLN